MLSERIAKVRDRESEFPPTEDNQYPEDHHVDGGFSSFHLLLIFLLKEQQKPGTFMLPKSRLGACCLTILIYTFIMFKGAMRPCHTYVPRFKGECLWYER